MDMLQGKIKEVKVRDSEPLEYGPPIEYDPESEHTEQVDVKPFKEVVKECENSKQSTG